MRSKQIHTAIAQGNNRFEICQMVSKAVRLFHKNGRRLEDSITEVMGMLSADSGQLASMPILIVNPKA